MARNQLESSEKFTPIDLDRYFNASLRDFGPRPFAKGWGEGLPKELTRTPSGAQVCRGIPFLLGPERVDKKCWIALSARANSWARQDLEIPLNKRATFICLCQFCDWDMNEEPLPGEDVIEKIGQPLAQAVLVYEDGAEHSLPIRRRFEVTSPMLSGGQYCLAALPYRIPEKHFVATKRNPDPGPGPWICALGACPRIADFS